MSLRVAACRRVLACLTCLTLVAGLAPAFAQASTATITGIILSPDGKPSVGFKAVLRDVASGKEFMSEPTDPSGTYVASVPIGGRYKLAGVIASDGTTRLPVQDTPPVSILGPGTTRVNIRFSEAPAAGAGAATAAAAPATVPKAAPPAVVAAPPEKAKKDKSGAPWYKRPGPITGMVIGGVAIAALAVSGGGGGGDTPVASASSPEDR
jgi:hypothetical protein